MHPYVHVLMVLIISYFIGSTMSAIWVAKLFKLPDPRSYGSKNPGATNMARGKSKKAALLTFAIDIMKGYVICWVLLSNGFGNTLAFIAGSCAILGHMFPFFHNFQGGKGAATFFGVVVAINTTCGIISFTLWTLVIAMYKNTGLGTVVTSIVTPFIINATPSVKHLTLPVSIMCLIVILKHSENLKMLYQKIQKKDLKKESQTEN